MNPHVVNVKTAYAGYIYIGRAMPSRGLEASIYANPFSHNSKAKGIISVSTREMAVDYYRRWLTGEMHPNRYDQRKAILDAIPTLALQMSRGFKLGCWCAPQLCHGEVLVELVEKHLGHPLDFLITIPAPVRQATEK